LLARLKQVKTRPIKARLVKRLGEGGFVKFKVAFKGGKVKQVPDKTV
jgi:hypothetical protein